MFVGIKKDFNLIYRIEIKDKNKIMLSIVDSYDDEIHYCSFFSWGEMGRPGAQLSFAILRAAGLSFKEAYSKHFSFLQKVISRKKKDFFILREEELLPFVKNLKQRTKRIPSIREDKILSLLNHRVKHFVSYYKLPIKDPRPAIKKQETLWRKLKPGEKIKFQPPSYRKIGMEFLIEREKRNTFSIHFRIARDKEWKLIHDFYGSEALRKISVFIEGMLNLMERVLIK